ncbi:D-amino acid dehydrogenase [Caenimonas soli]|uniref:D-amino acid dehydrogenase n=1 Tax=Caenimonas soli TaxID=2735555 RepID=UPI00155267C3|nr:D-amino acid dehydrogenase [Caenimonas soli]NPC57900.1 D-amino acid dehydrogenase [Caenimonas soli]
MGSGIVGLSTAAALLRAGMQVRVIDAGPAPGSGASGGNGCQLSYAYVAPLAAPGLLPEIPRLLMDPASPLSLKLRPDKHQWQWMLRFLAACRYSLARRSTLDLIALAALSRAETELWAASCDPEELGFKRSGKLVLHADAAGLQAARAQMQMQAAVGPAQHELTEAQCLRVEPALDAFRGKIAGAIHTPSECVVDGLALCRNLHRALSSRGVSFHYGVSAEHFVHRKGRVLAVATRGETLDVDELVLANGTGCASLARKLGIYLPVYPLKGYSITAKVRDARGAPRVSVTDARRKVVYARIGERVRVAGVAEIGAHHTGLDARRIEQLVAYANESFGSAIDLEEPQPWAGLRPATPSSVPVIGRTAYSNTHLNVGHGALGLTLAFGSARLLADMLAGLAPALDPSVYALGSR